MAQDFLFKTPKRMEMKKKQKSKRNIQGSSMLEYILLVGLIGAAAIIPMGILGESISTFFERLADQLDGLNNQL